MLTNNSLERKPPHILLTVLIITLIGIGAWIGISLLDDSVVYYKTPAEVINAGPSTTSVRLAGTVEPGSITTNIEAGTVSFKIKDGQTAISVVYYGIAPDTLKDNSQAVAEGTLDTDGIFYAKTLFAKCASKFQSE